MDITIYEDQTGLMLFPVKKTEKDTRIVSFFNNNVDLYIEKNDNIGGDIRDNFTICCHLMAFEESARPLGYYIIYKGAYNDSVFSNFKRDVDGILNEQRINPRIGHEDNMIFENMYIFDRDQYYKEFIEDSDGIREAIKNRKIEYSSGDIKEISAFCNTVLKNIGGVKISISSTRYDIGDINILLNKKQVEPLRKIGNTEQIIKDAIYALKLHKKRENGAPIISKMKDGLKENIDKLVKIEYSPWEIKNEITNITTDILDGYSSRHEAILGLSSRRETTLGPSFRRKTDTSEERGHEDKGHEGRGYEGRGYEEINRRDIGKGEIRGEERIKEDKSDDNDIHIKNLYVFAIIGILLTASFAYLYISSETKSMGGMYERARSFLPGYKDTNIGTDTDVKELPKLNLSNVTNRSNTTTVTGSNTFTVEQQKSYPLIIIGSYPESYTNVSTGNVRNFVVMTNQIANFTWYLDDEQIQYDMNTENSKYNATRVFQGVKKVKVSITNANGSISREWSLLVDEKSSNITDNKNITNNKNVTNIANGSK